MKTLLMISLLAFAPVCKSQSIQLPPVDIVSLDGKQLSAKDLTDSVMPTVLIFWNTDDPNCIEYMRQLNETYENEWKGQNFRMIGICSNRSSSDEIIRPLVNILGLAFDTYIDRNDNLKRALSIPDVPFTLVINPDSQYSFRFEGVSEDITTLLPSSAGKSFAGNSPAW